MPETRPLPHFHEWIREFREQLGFNTQWKFAQYLKIPPGTVNRWETGNTTPRFVHLQQLYELAVAHNLLPFFAQLEFETVFLCGDIWRGEAEEAPGRIFLRATVRNVQGIAAKILGVIAANGGNVLRLAGFQEGDREDTSIFRVIFTLPEDQPLNELADAIAALEHVIATEYPARCLCTEPPGTYDEEE